MSNDNNLSIIRNMEEELESLKEIIKNLQNENASLRQKLEKYQNLDGNFNLEKVFSNVYPLDENDKSSVQLISRTSYILYKEKCSNLNCLKGKNFINLAAKNQVGPKMLGLLFIICNHYNVEIDTMYYPKFLSHKLGNLSSVVKELESKFGFKE